MNRIGDMITSLTSLMRFDDIVLLLAKQIKVYSETKSRSDRDYLSMICSMVISKEIQESENINKDKIKDLPPDLQELARKLKNREL